MSTNTNGYPDQNPFPDGLDHTFVEGSGSVTPLQSGTRINSTAVPNGTNPYTQNGAGYPQGQQDILPTGNDPIPLGSGTVVGLLGSGGMAKVYKIWNEKLEVFRAAKILLPTQQADLKSRFETEAKITAKLHHPNIVEIYGVGDWNGLPYLEMEYLDGDSLEAMIASNGKLPDVVCSAISILIARALEYAHSQEFLIYGKTYHGVIHRDLKPANIMIPQIGDVRLMDFGIARPTEASLHTVEGNIVGTMQYLSPEQMDGIDIDARSDIYSFGAILYEVLTGTKTFPQDTITNLMKKKIMNEYRKFSDFDFAVSNQLGRIAQKCLQINKTDRFLNAAALLVDLEAAHRSLTSETPAAILKQYLIDPESIASSHRKKLSFSIPAKILIPTIGIAGIAALITVFILTGPQSTSHTDPPVENKPAPPATTVNVPEPLSAQTTDTITQKKPAQTTRQPKRPKRPKIVARKPRSKTRVKPSSSKKVVQTAAGFKNPPAEKQKDSVRVITDLSPLEQLKKNYGHNDLFAIGREALKKRKYKDAILAFNNVPAGEGNSTIKTLSLFEVYLSTGKLGEALLIATKETISDAQFDLLCGMLYEKTGKKKVALEYYSTALTKPSLTRSRNEIRNDALYQTAILRTAQHQSAPTSDSRIQALNAWNTVKRTYMKTPNHPRFKKANTELASIQ